MPEAPSNAVALGIEPPKSPAGGPLDMALKYMELNKLGNANELFQQQMQARQEAGRIMAEAPDFETGLQRLSQSKHAPYVAETINSLRAAMQAQVETEGKSQSQAEAGIQGFLKALPTIVEQPTEAAWNGLLEQRLGTLSPKIRKIADKSLGALKQSLLDGLPEDTAQATSVFKQRLAANILASGGNRELLETLIAKPETLDLGGYKQPIMRLPPQHGGGIQSVGPPLQVTAGPQAGVDEFGAGGARIPFQIGGQLPPGSPAPGPTTRMGFPVPSGTGQAPAPAAGPASAPDYLAGTPDHPRLGFPQPTGPTKPPGLSGPGLIDKKYSEGRGTDMADYQRRLDSTVQTGNGVLQTVSEATDALKRIKAGGGASAYARLAEVAQAFGAGNELVDKIANQDLAASQEFEKLMVNTTMGQIEQQLPSGSRMAVDEFNTFKKNNPNINTDPRAIDKIFNFWKKVYERGTEEQQGLNEHLAAKKPISEWPAEWQKRAKAKGYIGTPSTSAAKPPAEHSDEELKKILGIK